MEQVRVTVDESALSAGSAEATPLDDTGFSDFAVAGTQVSGEFRCADCGYGAVVHRELPHCPMCGGTIWQGHGPLAPQPDE